MILIKQLIILSGNILHCILIHPIVDNYNFLFRYTFSHDISLETFRNNNYLVRMLISKVLYHTPYPPYQSILTYQAGTCKRIRKDILKIIHKRNSFDFFSKQPNAP